MFHLSTSCRPVFHGSLRTLSATACAPPLSDKPTGVGSTDEDPFGGVGLSASGVGVLSGMVTGGTTFGAGEGAGAEPEVGVELGRVRGIDGCTAGGVDSLELSTPF
jgi:hypothetical protein